MFVFVFKDSKNNNKVEITAPTKTAAMEMVKRVAIGDGVLRYESHRKETEAEWYARMNRQRQKDAKIQAQQQAMPKILKRRKAFSRNDRCPCGSGKKVKHCRCMRA